MDWWGRSTISKNMQNNGRCNVRVCFVRLSGFDERGHIGMALMGSPSVVQHMYN